MKKFIFVSFLVAGCGVLSPDGTMNTSPGPTADMGNSPDVATGQNPDLCIVSVPSEWVARSGIDNIIELNSKFLSNTTTARLVGEPRPLDWVTGPTSTSSGGNAGYYQFNLATIGMSTGIARLTYRDASRGDNWAEYGGKANFDSLSSVAKEWLCQYRDDQSRCVSGIFVDYDGRNVIPAGRASCANRVHDGTCPNLHR